MKQARLLFSPNTLLKTLGATLLVSTAMSAFAVPFTPKDLVFDQARAWAPLKGASVSAGFVKVTNNGDSDVELKIVSAAPFKAAELHETIESEGKTTMRPLPIVKIPAHQAFEFKPGAAHIMFFDPTKPVAAGETLEVKFTANGKSFERPFKVESRTAVPAAAK